MNDHIHQFQIGDFQAFLLHDMQFTYKGPDFFSNVEPDHAAKGLERYHHTMEHIPSPYVSLLLVKEEQKILIDTGLGFRQEPMEFKGVKFPIKGRLRSLLKETGVGEEEITGVILTHLHPDHIGGVCDENAQPVFPKAKYYIHQHEWDYWYRSGADQENPLFKIFIEQNIHPIKNSDLTLIKQDEFEITPGIQSFKVPGHTPGQLALQIESLGEKLLFISDVWLHPLHIEYIDWQTNYDKDHGLAKKSRVQMLELAYRENMLVQSFHFAFPGLGKIDKTNSGWKWVVDDQF